MSQAQGGSKRGLLTRRRALVGLGAMPLVVCAQTGRGGFGSASAWRLGQTVALSGPLADLGQAMHLGAKACFAAVNARGGVHGRPIELVAQDDGYDVKRSLAHVEMFLRDPSIFALFNCMGTPMIEAMLPAVKSSGIPLFAPFTGALSARAKDIRNVFNIRASYADEAQSLVRHLDTIGLRKIAIAYQDNAFGKEVYEAARSAMQNYKMPDAPVATVKNDASDAADAAEKLIGTSAEAVLIGLAGKPTIEFVKAVRARRHGFPLYALSIMGSAATIKALGDDGVGIAVSQVVPLPTSTVVPVVRDFHEALQQANVTLEPSHVALEGYINARACVEALRRAGANATRAAFIDSTWAMREYDLGSFFVRFTAPGSNASSFVDLTMIRSGGKFIR